MNVIKIVVDELPERCLECLFSQGIIPDNIYCTITEDKVDEPNTRPLWCPLVVEDECVWVLDYHVDTEMWNVAPDCCVGEFFRNKPNYKTCPNCGKRIKYVEES